MNTNARVALQENINSAWQRIADQQDELISTRSLAEALRHEASYLDGLAVAVELLDPTDTSEGLVAGSARAASTDMRLIATHVEACDTIDDHVGSEDYLTIIEAANTIW